MNTKELKAMISLLDDPDFEVVSSISDNLLRHGTDIIPFLEKAWENSYNELLQERIETVIQDIHFDHTKNLLKHWIKNKTEPLWLGAAYVAQIQYPELKMVKIEEEFESIRNEIWMEVNNNLTAVEKVQIINYMLFERYKYRRNSSNFYAPQNSLINQVIDTKKGNPISLGIIYLSIADKLGLPVYGVNLPKNFILAYKNEFRQYDSQHEENDILFYINPYNKGAILGRREIDYFLKHQNIKKDKTYYVPCSNTDIINRLINNLILAYERLGYTDKLSRLKILSDLLSA